MSFIKNTFICFFIIAQSITSQKIEWETECESLFSQLTTEHFVINYFDSSYASKHIQSLALEREEGYSKIAGFFETGLNKKVNLFFFPDEITKYKITGHKGNGWGYENNIVEVINDSTQVDPYHELAHIFIYQNSAPPALLDEGLAVFLSDKFGHNGFLELIGHKGNTINNVLRIFLREQELLPIESLLRIDKISESQNVLMAYLESVSFVEFLITNYAKGMLFELIERINNSKNAERLNVFESVYGKTLSEVEKDWLRSI